MQIFTYRVSLALASVLGIGAVVLAVFEHQSFVAGVLTGLLGALALAMLGVAIAIKKFEAQMLDAQERLGEQLGIDVSGLMGNLSGDGSQKIAN